MTLVEEQGVEFLWLTDQEKRTVEKVTLEGKVVQTITQPDHQAYREGPLFPRGSR